MGKMKDLLEPLKEEVMQFLNSNLKNERLAKGKINEVASLFTCCRKTISIIQRSTQEQRSKGEVIQILGNRATRMRNKKHEVNITDIEAVNIRKEEQLDPR